MKFASWLWLNSTEVSRIVVLIALGAALLYGLGRWDARVNEKDREFRNRATLALQQGKALRVTLDSLALVREEAARRDSTAEREVARLRGALAARLRADSIERSTLAALPVDSLLRDLRVTRVGPNDFRLDSAAVRAFASSRLRGLQLERQVSNLDSLLRVRDRQVSEIRRGFDAASRLVDSLRTYTQHIEGLLEESIRRRQCKIARLLPCPSRTTSLVVGVGVGIAATILLKE